MTYAHLLGNHYYRLTYAFCQAGSSHPLCAVWLHEAMFEMLAVVLIAIAAWIYNERRDVGN
jgi:hypothetical protein